MTSTDMIDGAATARARSEGAGKTAALYRMAMPGHLCPFGLTSLSLLRRKGFEVNVTLLTTREEVDAFQAAHGVDTTPQAFIDGNRIGGCIEPKEHFGHRVLGEDATSYTPVIAIFASTALMALAIVLNLNAGVAVLTWLKWIFATSMVVDAIQKLQDVGGFVNGFLG